MPVSTVTIQFGSANWEIKTKDAIDQKKHVKLVVKGIQAQTTAEALRRNSSTSNITGAEVALAAAVIIGIIAVVGLGVVAAVCLYGINQGYKVVARHRVKGPMPFDDELEFDLQPPPSP